MRDEELVRRIKRGDRKSADILIERHYSAILRYCSRHCRDPNTAEDITQETFFRVFRNFGSYEHRGKFRAYLYKIAYNLCADEFKAPVCGELDEDIEDPGSAFDEVEDRDQVDRLLGYLSGPQREAVILRFGEQLSFKEIAEVVGAPVRTVQSRVRLALKVMKDRERKYYDIEGEENFKT